ncbi:HAMP domain-containing protein [Dactylosporangium sp. NPDC049140]|uniref:sensor histidine kinase n=1 Tax=Dactylosporangium sp. NPDC049140 TaxID=3155647 RepID=UPI003403B8C6
MSRTRGGLISRMVLATGVLLLIVGAAFGVLLISINEQRSTARVTRHAQQVFDAVEATERSTDEVQTRQLQYFATGDAGYVADWQAATADVQRATEHLEHVATTSNERRHAQHITQIARSYVDDYSVPVMDAARRGDPSVRDAATMREGDRRIAELHTETQALRMTERQIVDTRDARADRQVQQEILAVVCGLAGSALVIALVGWYQTRIIVQPIRRVAAMADQLASGDLGTRLPETGTVEIGRLERFFNVMAASLERGYRELTDRVETQTALRRIATLVARGVPSAEVMAAVAAELGQLIDTESVRLVRYEPDGTGTIVGAWGGADLDLPVGTRMPLDGHNVTAMVLRTGRPARIDDFANATGALGVHLRERGLRAAVGAPIHVEGRLWGVVASGTARDEPPPSNAEARLAEYTDLIGTAIANTQARADLIASRSRFVLATDQARRRIEHDLHDGIQQRLISLGLDLRRLQEDVPTELPVLREELSAVVAGLTGTVDDVRELSRGVHPAILSDGGLRPALRALARRSGMAVNLDVRLDDRLPEPVEVAAYYVVAESLTNATKHAQATVVSVQADVGDHQLHLVVRDDGVGGAEPGHGSGLIGLADRVEALGGTLTLHSPRGCGTCLEVRLPLDEVTP